MLVPLSVSDCMTRDVETIEPTVSVQAAAQRLSDAVVGSLVVCEGAAPVGIITESDLVRLLATQAALDEVTVREVMSAELFAVGPEASLEEAAELLTEQDIRRLPVVEDEELVGIVTTTDLADYLPRLAKRRRRAEALSTEGEQIPAEQPEMAYDEPDWRFDQQGTETGVSVGDTVRFRKELTDADVRAFAEASGDTNRLHLDDDFASKTRFGNRIVHGVLTTGLISAALARLPGLTIFLSQDVSFLGPISVDETATAVCTVTEELGGQKFRLDVGVYDGEGEQVVAGDSIVLIDELPEEMTQAAEPLT